MKNKLIYVGSEGIGYHSGAEGFVGVLVDEELYTKHKENLSDYFDNYIFYELNGKHSEVEGSLVVKEFDSLSDAIIYTHNIDLAMGSEEIFDLAYEWVEDCSEESVEKLCENIAKNEDIVEKSRVNYEHIELYLPKTHIRTIKDFIETLKN